MQASKKILLISKAYQQRKSAENAVKRLYQKKVDIAYQSVADKQKKEKHYFQLLDGNKKAMANSHAFSSLADAKLASQGFRTYIQDKSKVPEASKNTPEVHQPVRGRFRLDFYYDTGEHGLRGQIEDVPSREKKEFVGLDMTTIQTFLSDQLKKDAPATAKVEKKTQLKEQPKPELQVALQELGDASPHTSFPVGTPLEVAISLSKARRDESAATIYLRSLGGREKILLTEEKVSSNSTFLKVPVYTQELQPGFYQVIATLKSRKKTASTSKSLSQASSVIQLY